MKRIVMRSVVLMVVSLFGALYSIAQTAPYDPSVFIDISINSGNPTYPYPQFKEYKGGGKSLAKYNAEGVTHADMEKAGREAYEIMMHRSRYMGGTHCGVKYITFNHDNVPGNYGTFVSEGDGYALLAAAIFADQKTFNGLYMWVHDNRMSGVERFKDGTYLRSTLSDYAGPYLAGWKNDETTPNMSPSHSATDGDVDIAMAMLIAYKQWGEWMMQDGQVVKNYAGKPISLKEEAYRVITALVDTLPQWDKGSGQISGYLSGDIGIDGYCKKGNSWGELTRWRFSAAGQAAYPGMNGPYNGGPNLYSQYGTLWIDYDAPSYFDEFYRWFKNGDGGDGKDVDWQVHQFQRAAASGNYLNREAYKQGHIASIGNVTIGDIGQNPAFNVYVDGEDFRYAWRHLVDYLWHGTQQYDWDPATHQVIKGTNNSEYDMALRHAQILKNPTSSGTQLCAKMGASPDPGQPSWFGVAQIPQQWTYNGGVTSPYHTNYSVGSGAPAAVISEDMDLLADIYRQCEIMWDGNNTAAKLTPEERYIGSTPKYFHGWFRTLGMLVCSGNLAAPEDMLPMANMKVYMSVDKTYAYQNDKIKYTVQYRNYGSLAAQGVKIQTPLDVDYTFVSATDGGTYDAATHTITWNIGTVPGFVTGGLNATIDSVSFEVKVTSLDNARVCETSTITANNCEEWVSNEYPNHATYTMERNCVDVLANRSLLINKEANRVNLNPGDVVTFTVDFENKSTEDSWMNGGRDNVRISYGNYYMAGNAYQFYQLYRFWNDSYESYINMHNYRVSYFMYDAAAIGLYDAATNNTGWTFVVDNQNDLDKYGYNPASGAISFAYQKIPQGQDANGKWNQRLMIRFADVLMAPTTHVYDKLDSDYLLHKGVRGPGFIRARLAANPAQDLSTRVQDDWSFSSSVTEKSLDGQGTTFTLVTPCWANYDDLGYEIDNYSRHVCSPTSVKNYDRVLVEEFDGYTWRRIQGRGPLPGKEAYNVTIVDTIPLELQWKEFIDKKGLGIEATYTPAAAGKPYSGIVKWTVPEMLVGEKDKLIYTCVAKDLGCPSVPDATYINAAWIYSDTDSPDSSAVTLTTTCTQLPPYIEPQNSLFKTASAQIANVGDIINYELKYKNTTGTTVKEDCSSLTNWMTLGGGSQTSVSGGALKLNTNGSGAFFFGPKYSYGVDGSVMLSFSGSPSSTQELYFVMRYISGTPGTTNFKGVCMKMFINKDGANNYGYELYNNGTLVKKEGSTWSDAIAFPGSSSNPVFKFVLAGDHLYMYINDAANDWTTVVKDWSGLTATAPGYFGMYVNSNGNGSAALDNFVSELDYAFDVALLDNIPDELTDIASISGGGTYNAGTQRITWPVVAGPIAPNGEISYTFDAKVYSCNNYINNYGMAKVYGQDTLKVVNTIKCGTTVCPDPPTVITPVTYCKGAMATALTAVGKNLKWYETATGGKSVASIIPPTTTVGKTTYYVSQTDGCESERAAIIVDVIETGAPQVVTPVSLCLNTSAAALTATGTDLTWYNSSKVELSGAPTPGASQEGDVSYYVTQTLNNCESEMAEIVVSVGSLPAPTVQNVSYCEGETAVPLTATATGTLVWYESATTKTALASAPTPSTTSLAPISYFVSQTSGGCESDRAEIKVTIKPSPESTISATKDSYCGTTSTVVLSLTSAEDLTHATYSWKKDAVATATTATVSAANAGDYVCVVTLDGCNYTTPAKTITQNAAPTYTIVGAGSYCPESTSKKPVVITFTAGTAPFSFEEAITGTGTSAGTTFSITDPAGGIYQLTSLTDANNCSMTVTGATVEVVDLATPDLAIGTIASVCEGTPSVDVSKYVTAGTGTVSYTTDKGTVSSVGVLTGLNVAGDYTVSVTVKGTAAPYCTNTKDAVVSVTANPIVSLDASYTVCSGTDLVLTPKVTSESTLFTYTWSGDGSGKLNSPLLEKPTFKATVSSNTDYTLEVKVVDKNSNCSGSTSTKVTVYALPTATLSTTQNYVCSDADITVTATVSDGGSGSGEWTNAAEVTELTATVDGSAYSAGTNTVSYVYTDAHSCKSAVATKGITVVSKPAAPKATTISYCLNATAKPLAIIGYTNLLWYGTSKTNVPTTTAPTPETTKEGNTTYYVSQVVDNCESDIAEVTVIIKSKLEPQIQLSKDEVCAGTAISISLSQEYTKQTWSGTAMNYLNSTTMAAPQFLATAPAGSYNLTVGVEDASSCTGTASVAIQVNEVPKVAIATDEVANCSYVSAAQIITATIEPADLTGSHKWTTVSSTTSTASFVPSAFGEGNQEITYQFISDDNCPSNIASLIMTVYPLTSISVTPSKTNVCASGDNSSDITMIPSQTVGTFEYSVNNGGTIASDGTFSPASNAAGDYIITLNYTDANSCEAIALASVSIHALPTIEFDASNPDSLCYTNGAYDLLVNCSDEDGALESKTTSFNPSTSSIGKNTITYTYKDVNGCVNSADYPIEVYKVAPPTITAPNPKTVTIDDYGVLMDVPSVSATLANPLDGIVWQNVDGSMELGTGTSYTSTETIEATYYYYAKETRLVEGTTCYSESAKATLVLSNCPAKSPIADDIVLCVGTDGTLELSASFAGAPDGKSLAWFSDETLASKLVDGGIYATTVATTAATTYTYFVAEYDDGGACWSIPTTVTAMVKDNPTVAIEDMATLCYASKTHTAVGKINGVVSTAGTWSIVEKPDAINSTTGIINTQSWGKTDGTYTLTYSYTDANKCSNSASKPFSVEFPTVPTSDGFVGLTANPQTVIVTANGTSLETASVVKWYESVSSTAILETSSSFTTGDDPATVHTVTYYLSQTVNGCESERGTSLVKIVDCPFLKPDVTSVVACQNETTLDDLSALLPSTTKVAADSWVWFDADENQLHNGPETSYASGVSTATAAVTTFYVAYLATDANTSQQCLSDKAAVTVTIHKLPTVEITDLERTLCYAEGDVQLTAKVNGTTNNTGTWSVTGQPSAISSMGVFNTKFNSTVDGNYTVVYSYTDGNTCTSQDDYGVQVEYPEVLSVDDYNGLVTNPLSVVLTAKNFETSAQVNWYLAGTSVKTTTNTWTTPDDPTVAHISTYSVSQTKNGCESEKTTNTVTISNCPFKEADVTNVEICQDETGLEDLKAELPLSTTVAADKWVWYDADGNELQNGPSSTYATSIPTSVAATTAFYVSYFATDASTSIQCASPRVKAMVTVNPKPVITFSVPGAPANKTLLCYDQGVEQLHAYVNYSNNGSGMGSWAVDGGTIGITSAGVFDPTAFGKVSDTYSVSYTYTDGKTCTNTAKRDLTVQYTPVPVVANHSSLVEENATVSVSATPIDGAAIISWYNATSTFLSNNNPYKTGDAGNVVTKKSYFATQTINTCESEKSEAIVTIINCPVPKPIVVQPNAICNYDDAPELKASLGAWTSGSRPTAANPEVFNFYKEETGGTPIASNTTGMYIPMIDETKAATYTYYVAEYNENVTPSACEGKRAKVTLVVKKPIKPYVSIVKNSVCQGEMNPQCSAIGQGSIQWYEKTPSYPAGAPDQVSATFVSSASEIGEHSVWATQTIDGCLSEAETVSFTIKAVPEAPITENASICYGSPKASVCVQGNVGTVTWYSDANASNALAKTICYSSSESYVGEYSYYATQTVDGCESEPTVATYTIVALPLVPVVVTEKYSCDYDSEHVLSVAAQSGKTVAWYSSADTASLLAQGNEFVHQITQSGSVVYFVRQIENGCVSNYVTSSFSIVARPAKPNVVSDKVCYGELATLYTDGSKDSWYSDESKETFVLQGRNCYVDEAIANETYYVVREKNGCFSETAEATVTVIPVPDVTITVDGEEASLIQRCVYDEEKPMVTTVSPTMGEDDYVSWAIFPGNITVKTNELLLSEHVPVTSQNTPNVTYTVRAQYLVKNDLHNTYCESIKDTIKVSTSGKARKPIVLSNVICQGEEIEPMFAYGTPNVTWISLDGILPIVAHGQRYEFSKQQGDLPVGKYSFVVFDIDMNTGCHSDSATVSLTLAPAAQTKIFGADSVCVNTTEMYYTQYNQTSQYNWMVTGNNLNYSKDAKSSSVQYVDWNYAGIDTLVVFEQTWAGCQGADTLVVKIANNPRARFVWEMPGDSNVLQLIDSTEQDSIKDYTANGELYSEEVTYKLLWNFGHLGSNSEQIDLEVPYNQRHYPITEGDYVFGYNCPILTAENSFGCSDSYTECIFIKITSNLYVPNAFSPTNPSHGVRSFQPKGYNLKTCKISVYDKWGNLVWYSDAVEDGSFVGTWDGKCNGKMMEAGTYIWKMEATFLDGQSWSGFDVGNGKKTKFGNVMLIR